MTLRDDDLPTECSADERGELARIAASFQSQRPVPAPAFRGELRRRLVTGRTHRALPRRVYIRRRAYGSLFIGGALLSIAAAGLAGIGPLTPDDVQHVIASLLTRLY
jgi:hypothetical protein